METAEKTDWGRVVTQALIAGIAAGFCIEAYLWATTIAPQHGNTFAAWQWIASAAIGPTAQTNVAYAWLGLLIHFIVSIAWAGGYAYLAQSRRFMNERWIVSGLIYGVVVYIFMDLLLLGAGKFAFPSSPNAFVNEVIAHTVFFGIPLAFVIAKLDAR